MADLDLVFIREPVDIARWTVTGRFNQATPPWSPESPHMGLDIGCPEGTEVFAPADGTVVDFTNNGSFGIGVCLDHLRTPYYSLFAHLRTSVVKVGEKVVAGQLIGFSGMTGKADGAHLHWQVCKTTAFPKDISQNADPLSFFAAPALTRADVEAIVDERIRRWRQEENLREEKLLGSTLLLAVDALVDRNAAIAKATNPAEVP